MIRSLSLKNFRAYRAQDFRFSRLNLFVGPNNSGKSSALSAINFIAQSISQRDINASPIAINGPFEELGTFLDIVHGNRASTPMGFDLEYASPARKELHNIKFEIKYRSQRREAEISKFSYLQNRREIYSYISRKDSFSVKLLGKKIELIVPELKKQRPRFTSIFPVDRTLNRYGTPGIYPGARTFPREVQIRLREADRSMRRGRLQLRDTFATFDSISPFRDQPERTYLFTGETPSRIGRTGSNGVSLLLNDAAKRGSLRKGFADRISEWLAVTRIASEIVVRPLTERHFEICVRDLDNKIHNICDVGFGCSQVLPVLVGALNILSPGARDVFGSTPTFVVQEPEIHLHPNAQAALGSFFASLVRSPVQIFLETHSDNLILRIANHVAAGHIDPQHIAIFYCQNQNGKKTVETLKIDEQGVFHPKWPGGFFPQREKETLTLARTRHQSDKPASGTPDFIYFQD